MTETGIKNAIKSIEIHHDGDWWIADMPDIGVATQAKTLPALGIEIERIIVAHFTANAEIGADPFRCKRLSTIDDLTETLNVVLETRTATYASMASALREIERRLLATAAIAVVDEDMRRIREEVTAAAAAVAGVASLVETPLTTKVRGN